MYVWSTLLILAIIWFMSFQRMTYEKIMFCNGGLFIVQAISMMYINTHLNRTITKIFNVQELQNEKNFLKCTLVVFTLSYFVVVLRTFAIFGTIYKHDDDGKDGQPVEEWVCENNFKVNLINVVCWLVIDLIPIGTIFYLHWKNFKIEAQKQYMLENMESTKDQDLRPSLKDANGNSFLI